MENEEVKKVSYKQLVWFFIVVIILWAASWFYTTTFVDTDNQGVFGDMFGGINALFSGLAFAGLIFAILLQRRELELQREELIETRKELSGQREALEKQNFDNAFFQLIRFQNEIVNSINAIQEGIRIRGGFERTEEHLFGKACFEYFYSVYKNQFFPKYNKEETDKMKIEKSFVDFF